MNQQQTTTLAKRVEQEFLPFVRRPSRYIGGEINQIKKDLSKCDLKIALCFPDIYEVGMSYTGLAILYEVLNRIDGVAAERAFAPWTDAENVLRKKQIPLFSLESRSPLRSFDIIGFSLTNELCYSNVLNMLDLAGLEVRSPHRAETDPIILGGGTMANCCEPVADFFDMFLLGEAEQAIVQLVDFIRTRKRDGTTKKQILAEAARKFEWLYVPALYRIEGDASGSSGPVAVSPDLPGRFTNAVVEDFDNAAVPLKPIVPFARTVHERISVEIMRGCPGRCRFCQASFCRRPLRYRSVDRVVDIARRCYQATGFDTVGLLSLSTADYPELKQLVSQLQDCFRDKHVGISVPSLRVGEQLEVVPKLVSSVRKSGLTIAVEAASEKVRQIINKPLKNQDLFAAVESAYKAGWQKLKLYFMVGLPGESREDIKAITKLAFELGRLKKKLDGRCARINVAVSWFVPKPHTPFGWLTQKPQDYFKQAKQLILQEKRRLGARFLEFKFHDIERSILESALGRGDRRLAEVIERAWQAGARFDLWNECFDYALWQEAFAQCGLDLETIAQREFAREETLPWEHLGGPDKEYLLKHLQDAMKLTASG